MQDDDDYYDDDGPDDLDVIFALAELEVGPRPRVRFRFRGRLKLKAWHRAMFARVGALMPDAEHEAGGNDPQ